MSNIQRSELEDLATVLKLRGRKSSEFEFEEEEVPVIDEIEIHPLYSTLRVTNKATGKMQSYLAGHTSKWVVEFDQDLVLGVI